MLHQGTRKLQIRTDEHANMRVVDKETQEPIADVVSVNVKMCGSLSATIEIVLTDMNDIYASDIVDGTVSVGLGLPEPKEEEGIVTTERVYPLTCYQLEELGMWDVSGCCSSCHEDEEIEEISYPLSEHILPDGREIRVCCRCRPWDAKTHEELELT